MFFIWFRMVFVSFWNCSRMVSGSFLPFCFRGVVVVVIVFVAIVVLVVLVVVVLVIVVVVFVVVAIVLFSIFGEWP